MGWGDTKGMSKQDRDLVRAQNNSWGCVADTPPVSLTKIRVIDSSINDAVVLVGVSVGAGGAGGAVGVVGFSGDEGCKYQAICISSSPSSVWIGQGVVGGVAHTPAVSFQVQMSGREALCMDRETREAPIS